MKSWRNMMINLKKTYLYAGILAILGTIVYAIWFSDLILWFLIAVGITLINYYFLIRIEKYQSLNHLNVLGTLFLRYLVYVIVAFIIIWSQKDSPILIEIGITLAIGFSIVQVSSIFNALIKGNGAKK